MNPDEMLLLEWLNKNAASPSFSQGIFHEIKTASKHSKAWLEQLRQWSREGIEGATSALNAAERIYGTANK